MHQLHMRDATGGTATSGGDSGSSGEGSDCRKEWDRQLKSGGKK